MRKQMVALTLTAVAALAGQVLAHEGHEHKVLGKVVAIDEKSIQVEGLDGKLITGVLTEETKYQRDQAVIARADIQLGERVVIVVVEEKEVQKVKQILLGTAMVEKKEDAAHKH